MLNHPTEGHDIVTSSRAMMRKVSASILTLLTVSLTVGLAQPANAADTKQVIIHYQDPAATGFDDYKNLDFYFWGGIAGGDYAPNSSDAWGKVLTLSVAADTASLDGLIKYGWAGDFSKKVPCANCTTYSNDADRKFVLNASGTTELWVVKGKDVAAYTSLADAVAAGASEAPGIWAANAVDPNFDCVDGVCVPHIVMPETQDVTIHMQDSEAKGFDSYQGFMTYVFGLDTQGTEGASASGDHYFTGSDSFGKVLHLSLSNTSKSKTFGLIVKKSDWSTRWDCDGCTGDSNGNRMVELSDTGTTEIWVLKGSTKQKYYTSLADAQAAGAGSAPWAAGASDPFYDCVPGVCTPVKLYPANQHFIVHYNRPKGDYGDCTQPSGSLCWNIWMWGTNTAADNTTVAFTGSDSFGKVLDLPIAGDTQLLAGWGFLLRSTKDWGNAVKDLGNRAITVAKVADGGTATSEVWIQQGTEKLYTAADFKTPTVSSLSVMTGGPGTAVTVYGTNLDLIHQIKIGTKLVSFTKVSATSAVFTVPTGASTGKIVVANPLHSGQSAANFAVTTKNAKATIMSNTATGLAGDIVTVKGANIGAATAVTLGALPVDWDVVSADQITFPVPDNATDGKITITTASAGTVSTTKSFALKPVITSVSSSAAVGATVTVTGKNLGSATSVKIGTKAVTVASKGATTITFVVAAGTASGKITVTTPGGTVVSSGSVTIVPAPTVSSASGTLKAGSTVAVSGTNFTGATRVAIGGTVISSFTVNSATSISFKAPGAGATGKISVTTPGGTASSSKSYTIS